MRIKDFALFLSMESIYLNNNYKILLYFSVYYLYCF